MYAYRPGKIEWKLDGIDEAFKPVIQQIDVVSAEDRRHDIAEGALGCVDLSLIMLQADTEPRPTWQSTIGRRDRRANATSTRVIFSMCVIVRF